MRIRRCYVSISERDKSFLHILPGYDELPFTTRTYNPQRLSIDSISAEMLKQWRRFAPHLRCLLFRGRVSPTEDEEYLLMFQIFKLLRVLDVNAHLPSNFLQEVELFVHLRHLAIECKVKSIPPGIANLSRLETFIITRNEDEIMLPNTIWNMTKLRHLCCWNGFIFPSDTLEVSPDLYNLETCTLSVESSSESLQKKINKLPSIRKLRCWGHYTSEVPTENCKGLLIELDTMSLLKTLRISGPFLLEFGFSLNLKKLTLTAYGKPWSEISTIGKLPNLEVLKLLYNSFVGETWETEDGEFPKLRFLKLELLDICWRTASGDNFPHLQKLLLHGCHKLEGLPSCLGEIPNIDMIEVMSCCESTIRSAKQIQEEQRDMSGNESLKLVTHSNATGSEHFLGDWYDA